VTTNIISEHGGMEHYSLILGEVDWDIERWDYNIKIRGTMCILLCNRFIYVKRSTKVWFRFGKVSHYRPGEVLSIPGDWDCQLVDYLHMKMAKLSALRIRRLYPQEIPLVPISVRGWVDNRATLLPEVWRKWKLQMTQEIIELAIFRFLM